MSTTESDIRSQATATTFGSRRLTSVLHPVSISFALIGILVTLFAAASLYRSEQKRSETIVNGKESLIEERIRHQQLAGIHISQAGSAYVRAKGSIAQRKWDAFSQALLKNHRDLGILGIGYLEKALSDGGAEAFEIPRFGDFSALHFSSCIPDEISRLEFSDLVGLAQAEAMSSAFYENDSAFSSEVDISRNDENEEFATFVFHPVFEEDQPTETVTQKSDALLGFVFCMLKLDEPASSSAGRGNTDRATAKAIPASTILSEVLSTPAEELRFELRETQNRSDSLKLLPLLIASAGVAFTLVGLLFLSDSRLTEERATKIAINMAESLERREKEVVQLNAELEDKVEQRTAQLKSANQELEAFSYTLSHDLRTPVRHIDHLTSCLREDCNLSSESEAENLLTRICKCTERMDQMITDILTLAGQASTPPKLRKVDLSVISTELIEMHLASSEKRERNIRIEDGMTGEADPTMIRVVIQNLLENALKFSESKEIPEIRCGSIPVESGKVYFVSDNGSGFKMKHAEKLYLPFKRLHRDKEIVGSGIGMATVKKIITHHGGTILCQSEVGIGTTFYFTLSRQEKFDLDELAAAAANAEVQPIVIRSLVLEESTPRSHHSPKSETIQSQAPTVISRGSVPARL